MRVAAGVLIALPYVLLPVLWALSLIPLGGLLPLVTAPLALRLGERASYRSGATFEEIRRDALIWLGAFVVSLAAGLTVPVAGS